MPGNEATQNGLENPPCIFNPSNCLKPLYIDYITFVRCRNKGPGYVDQLYYILKLTSLLLSVSRVSVKPWARMNPEGASDTSWQWRERSWWTVNWSNGAVSKGEGGAGGGEGSNISTDCVYVCMHVWWGRCEMGPGSLNCKLWWNVQYSWGWTASQF